MTAAVQTRPATRQDVPRLAVLFDQYRQFYGQQPDRQRATRFISERMTEQQSVIIVAEVDGGELAGFCQLYPTFCSVAAAPIFVLYDLFVESAHRRSGVAKALMQAAEACATDAGVARMDLSTARTNLPAQSLYEALGWKRDEAFYTYSKQVR